MKPIVYWIEKARTRKPAQDEFNELGLRRGRLRVQKPKSIAYLYIEDPSQMHMLYDTWHDNKEQIELQLHLRDREEAQIVGGVPKPDAPPYHNPPFHLKARFPFAKLSFGDEVG